MGKKRKFPVKVSFLFMNHWGSLYILPCVELSVNYSMPTIILQWWVFRVDIVIYKRFSNWFMEHVWSVLNFDFIKKKEKEIEIDEEDYEDE